MENGSKPLVFKPNDAVDAAASVNVRGILYKLLDNINKDDDRPTIPLGHGDPSPFPSFRTSTSAEDAVIDAVRSGHFNSYAPTVGLLPARRAIADYLSSDLSYQLSPDDVYLTVGCTQSIEIMITVLARPGANILLPKPGYPMYEARAAFSNLEVRHFDLLPEKGWEVDLDSVEALSDDNTVAMVIVSPGNPCGNIFTHQHLKKIAETARKLRIFVISDEVYGHLAFGSNPFVPMGEFGSIVPVVTLGSISKRWIVPGWRLGWIVTNDPNNILKESGIVQNIKSYLNITSDAATFMQVDRNETPNYNVSRRSRRIGEPCHRYYKRISVPGEKNSGNPGTARRRSKPFNSLALNRGAVPQILEKTKGEFFSKIIDVIREAADICFERIKEIPCISCPRKPDGSMFVMVKLDVSVLEDIRDDWEFTLKLAKEESVVILPGFALGMKNWLRITFAVEPESLEEGFGRIKAFCQRHAKK